MPLDHYPSVAQGQTTVPYVRSNSSEEGRVGRVTENVAYALHGAAPMKFGGWCGEASSIKQAQLGARPSKRNATAMLRALLLPRRSTLFAPHARHMSGQPRCALSRHFFGAAQELNIINNMISFFIILF